MDASTQFSINSNYNQFHQIINVPKLKSLFVIRKQYCFHPRKRFFLEIFPLYIGYLSHFCHSEILYRVTFQLNDKACNCWPMTQQ